MSIFKRSLSLSLYIYPSLYFRIGWLFWFSSTALLCPIIPISIGQRLGIRKAHRLVLATTEAKRRNLPINTSGSACSVAHIARSSAKRLPCESNAADMRVVTWYCYVCFSSFVYSARASAIERRIHRPCTLLKAGARDLQGCAHSTNTINSKKKWPTMGADYILRPFHWADQWVGRLNLRPFHWAKWKKKTILNEFKPFSCVCNCTKKNHHHLEHQHQMAVATFHPQDYNAHLSPPT